MHVRQRLVVGQKDNTYVIRFEEVEPWEQQKKKVRFWQCKGLKLFQPCSKKDDTLIRKSATKYLSVLRQTGVIAWYILNIEVITITSNNNYT